MIEILILMVTSVFFTSEFLLSLFYYGSNVKHRITDGLWLLGLNISPNPDPARFTVRCGIVGLGCVPSDAWVPAPRVSKFTPVLYGIVRPKC